MRRIGLACAIIVAVLSVTLPASALAECDRPFINWGWGVTVNSTWHTSGGSVCVVTFRWPEYNAKIDIASKPKHGMAGKDGPFGVAYKPNPGYRGRDDFVFRITSTSGFRVGTVNVSVVVE
jgi:hypothetical protein